MSIDEYLDIVDDNDKVIGVKKRSEVYAENLSNFRVVNAFIFNSKGEMWIPRRSPNKKIFPSSLDTSMGGHVESGESYENAFKRETFEELNLNIDTANIPYKLVGYLTPKKNNVSAFMKVYELYSDKTPDFNKDDFTDFFWITPTKLLELIETGEKTKGDLPKLLRALYCPL